MLRSSYRDINDEVIKIIAEVAIFEQTVPELCTSVIFQSKQLDKKADKITEVQGEFKIAYLS